MRRSRLFTILVIIIITVFVLCLCGCQDATPKDTYENLQEANADSSLEENDQVQSEPSANEKPEEPNNDVSDEKEKDAEKEEPAEKPWEEQDMTGIPEVIDSIDKDDGDDLVLVNKLHAVSSDYKPTDMVDVDGALSTNQGLKLKKEAYVAYKKMLAAAQKDEISFSICSTYRSYELQNTLYNNSLKNRGEKTTNLRSAYPGRSEHHTGLAIDVTSQSMGWGLSQDFINYPEGKWINEHCAEYGFIVRYPKGKTDITGYAYEPWHIRYVGTEAAKEIMEKGITLEEYLGK